MRKYIILLFAVLMVAACAKVPAASGSESGSGSSSDPGQDQPGGDTPVVPVEDITIQVTLPDIDSIEVKTVLSAKSEGGFRVSWSTGDAILVGGERFTLVSAEGQTGTFSGKKPQGAQFDIIYPADASASDSTPQAANDDFTHLRYQASLTGVDAYKDVVFGYGWASEHGGTFQQTGCLKLVLNLPSSASSISLVSFEGEGLPSLSLPVTNGTLSGQSFTAYLPCGSLDLTEEKTVTVRVTCSNGEKFYNTFNPATQSLADSHVIRLVTAPDKWTRELNGKGSATDPYLIYNADDFNDIRDLLTENAYTYFRLNADINLSAYTSWIPINMINKAFGIMFDGQNHKISHFKCTNNTWASIFGVLHGEIKNLTVEDSEVVTTSGSPIGLVAAWNGNSNGTLQGRMENVHVVRGKVSSSAFAAIGGLSGRSGAGTFVNCSFDGTVERSGALTYESDYHGAGGILGEALEGVVIQNCSTSGTMTVNCGRGNGGILGYTVNSLDITGCQSTMNITSRDDVIGGIVGYYGNGTISQCRVQSNLTVTGKGSGSSYAGGIGGNSSGSVTITKCSYNGTIQACAGVAGGILAQGNGSSGYGTKISNCFSSGTIQGASVIGGIIGRASAQGLEVADCGSTMDINGSSNYNGGVLGDAPKNTTIRRCYATGEVKGAFGLGGVIGRAYGRQSASDSPDTDVNITVTDCIAFNSTVKTVTSGGENPANHYSGGAVIGFSSRPNTLKNCWRSPSLTLEFYADASLNVLFDHADSSPDTPLAQPSGSAKWFSPYHGKAAAASQSLNALARSLGWSSTMWDFSGSVPVPVYN